MFGHMPFWSINKHLSYYVFTIRVQVVSSIHNTKTSFCYRCCIYLELIKHFIIIIPLRLPLHCKCFMHKWFITYTFDVNSYIVAEIVRYSDVFNHFKPWALFYIGIFTVIHELDWNLICIGKISTFTWHCLGDKNTCRYRTINSTWSLPLHQHHIIM